MNCTVQSGELYCTKVIVTNHNLLYAFLIFYIYCTMKYDWLKYSRRECEKKANVYDVRKYNRLSVIS